jgi:MFS family permease
MENDEFKRRVTRKVDIRLIPFIAFLYLLSFLDRVNVGNVHDDLLKYNNLSDASYSWIASIFFVGYVIFELPSNLLMKRITPSIWIARIMITWGVISTVMAFARTFSSLMLCRLFLGVAEAGFFPGLVYYLTFWYPNEERAFRIALFYSAAAFAGAFGGLIAYGIMTTMEGVGGLHAYQWVFIIEGVPSIIGGFATIFYLPNFPETCSFLTDEEREVVLEKLGRKSLLSVVSEEEASIEGESKSSSSQDIIIPKESNSVLGKFFHIPTLKATLSSGTLWYFAVLYFCLLVPLYTSVFFLNTFLKKQNFSSITTNLLVIPPYFIATLSTLYISWRSDRKKERSNHLSFCALIGCLGFFGQALWGDDKDNFALVYISVILAISGTYPTVSCCLAWVVNIINGRISEILRDSPIESHDLILSTLKATQSAVVISFGNLGGLFGPLILHEIVSKTGKFEGVNWLLGAFLLLAAILSYIGKRQKL